MIGLRPFGFAYLRFRFAPIQAPIGAPNGAVERAVHLYPVKILLLTHAFYPHIGGLETVARVLAEEFLALGHEVQLVTRSPATMDDGRTSDDARLFPFPVHRNPTPRTLLRLTRWCDVFFQNNVSLQTLWPLLLVRRPWVVAHQTWLTRTDGTIGWQDRLKIFLLRFGSPVAISRAVAEPLPVRAEIIGNPYQADLFGLRPDVPRDRPLAFLGRLVSDKGMDLLLEALAILQREDGAAPALTVIGDGPERGALEAVARAHRGVVEFVGPKTGEELVRLLNAHRVLAVPSRLAEPFGVVALEGAACGCVVVGSNLGGLPDSVGPCGLLFPNHDAPALAAALRRALTDEDLHARVAAAAPAHLERHSPRHITERYVAMFESALGK